MEKIVCPDIHNYHRSNLVLATGEYLKVNVVLTIGNDYG